ncbi:MAG TPA: zinc ABC transporter permease [Deltaproteobacteria bacterium]|nr:zinc ABC transporter permease [Deltaproteobacteria bacterium]
MNTFLDQLTLYSAIIAAAIFIGGVVPLFKHWHTQRLPTILSLAAGIMLGSAFFDLMPEAYEILGKGVGVYVLAGFLFLYFIEKFITVHICEAFDCEIHHIGIAAFIGLAIHTLINGVALGSGMMVPGLGLAVFLPVAAHKGPEAFTLTSVLLHTGVRRHRILLIHLCILAMIPIGAGLAYRLIQPAHALWIGRAVAFSAGTFLHIAVSDLLPEVHKHSQVKHWSFLSFIAGLLLMWELSRRFLEH